MHEISSIKEVPSRLIFALANFQRNSILLLQKLFPEEIENSAHLEEYFTKIPAILGKQYQMSYIFDSGLASDLYPEGLNLRKVDNSYPSLSRHKRLSVSCDFFTKKINSLFQSGCSIDDLQLGYEFYFFRMRVNFLWGICRENKVHNDAIEHEMEIDQDNLEYPGEEFKEGLKREFMDKMNSMYFDSNRDYIKKVNFILNLYRDPLEGLGEEEFLLEKIASERGGEERFYISEVTSIVEDALSQFFDDFFGIQDLPKILGA